MRYKAFHEVEHKLDEYTEMDGQIDTVNIDFINSNAKSPGIIAKLKTSSYQNSVNVTYKISTGNNSVISPFVYTNFYSLDQQKTIIMT